MFIMETGNILMTFFTFSLGPIIRAFFFYPWFEKKNKNTNNSHDRDKIKTLDSV